MQARMNLFEVIPGGYKAMLGLENYIQASVDKNLLGLIKLRASQVNGCGFCLDMHTKHARKLGETEQRIYLLNGWREVPIYTDKERAVLALTEAITLVTDGHVPDEVYEEAVRHFEQTELADIIMAIVTINSWNRIAISARMIPN
ncbi:carboxymuconolactone decarboxylase family protein [Paenibacillus sp. NEAU-GSW1]|uniref:carboxymuconolactone decarboxylase family protein n=1 Tax=Paenibacillus sp. NEAU-GSW1 TaxID=2682486 RepID=UPI0012E2194F|nr:carboxymuconolactone decarboxylase family protein [Paenibacillus sp. NEAU-GSW1]MUT64590.1 carboxymuconolactone decarboxylase family protein [Paenibacillus sp. NEAU-GSW1]